jgi:predicted dehydrogenase
MALDFRQPPMTNDQSLRVGLIGLGEVGQIHLEAYLASSIVEVVAVAEVSANQRSKLMIPDGIKLYESHLSMLENEHLDVACVLTPASTHIQIACDCADNGVATLCEKPLAHSVKSAQAMGDHFALRNVPLGYGSSYRHLPAILKAKEMISAGAIGLVTSIREVCVTGRGPTAQRPFPYVHYPEGEPGGTGMGLVDHGIHLLDIMPWLIGSPIVSAWGRGNRSGAPLQAEYATLQFSNGAVGQLLYDDGTWPTSMPNEGLFSKGASWDLDGPLPAGRWDSSPATIHAHGTDGALRICYYANALFHQNQSGIREIGIAGDPAPAHFRRQIECFAADVKNKRKPTPGADDGIRALKILDAIYESESTVTDFA